MLLVARSLARALPPRSSGNGSSGLVPAVAAAAAAAGAGTVLLSERVTTSAAGRAVSSSASSLSASAATSASLLLGRQCQSRIWTHSSTSVTGISSRPFKATGGGGFSSSALAAPPSWSSLSPQHTWLLFRRPFASATTSSSSTSGFVAWYESRLHAHPIPTKMVTGGILWSVGDAVAQLVPPLTHGQALSTIRYDWARTGRAGFFGFAIHAPTSHLHFNFLEWMTVQSGFTGLQIPVFKAFMEQFVYWSWISNSMYHAAMGAMQGMNLEQIVRRIEDVLWDTQKAQWVFWIPVQLLNFRYVPVRHQLNVVLVTSVVWTALLSAWYPPTNAIGAEEGHGKEDKAEDVAAGGGTEGSK